MTTVALNTKRNCRINEVDIDDGFRVTLYPALMDLKHENNNMICAVKEIFTKFTKDKFIDQRLKLCSSTLVGSLVVDLSNMVETQIDAVRKAKLQLVQEMHAKFLDVSKQIDAQVMKLCKGTDDKHISFVENRLKNFVLEYNRKAEEDRLAKCEFHKKKLFQKVYLKLKESTSQDRPESENASNSNSASSGQPVEVKFKSNTKFTGGNPNNDPKNDNSVTNSVPAGPVPTPVPVKPPAQPELTDDEFNAIVKNTKLSEPEVVEVDGLSGFSYVWHLIPDEEHEEIEFCADKSRGRLKMNGQRLKTQDVKAYSSSSSNISRPSPLFLASQGPPPHHASRPTCFGVQR